MINMYVNVSPRRAALHNNVQVYKDRWISGDKFGQSSLIKGTVVDPRRDVHGLTETNIIFL